MLNCERCGEPYSVYAPWHKPLENHFYRCRRCNRTWYPYISMGVVYDEMECCASGSCEVCGGVQGIVRAMNREDS